MPACSTRSARLPRSSRARAARWRTSSRTASSTTRPSGEPVLAEAIVDAVRRFDPGLKFFGLAGSIMIDAARRAGLQAVEEVFADRGYMGDGSLVPRSQPGALIEDEERSLAQTLVAGTRPPGDGGRRQQRDGQRAKRLPARRRRARAGVRAPHPRAADGRRHRGQGLLSVQVLLTGFEPFDGAAINPSWEAARALDGWRFGEVVVRAQRICCVFGRALQELDEAIGRLRPQLVIAVGQAGGRSEITPERIAINIDDGRICDNAGCRPIDQPVVPGAPGGVLLLAADQGHRAGAARGGHSGVGVQQRRHLRVQSPVLRPDAPHRARTGAARRLHPPSLPAGTGGGAGRRAQPPAVHDGRGAAHRGARGGRTGRRTCARPAASSTDCANSKKKRPAASKRDGSP